MSEALRQLTPFTEATREVSYLLPPDLLPQSPLDDASDVVAAKDQLRWLHEEQKTSPTLRILRNALLGGLAGAAAGYAKGYLTGHGNLDTAKWTALGLAGLGAAGAGGITYARHKLSPTIAERSLKTIERSDPTIHNFSDKPGIHKALQEYNKSVWMPGRGAEIGALIGGLGSFGYDWARGRENNLGQAAIAAGVTGGLGAILGMIYKSKQKNKLLKDIMSNMNQTKTAADLLEPSTVKALNDFADLKKNAPDLANENADLLYAYVDKGSRATNSKLMGKPLPQFVIDTRKSNLINTIAPSYYLGDKSEADIASSASHYNEFARGPIPAYFKLMDELRERDLHKTDPLFTDNPQLGNPKDYFNKLTTSADKYLTDKHGVGLNSVDKVPFDQQLAHLRSWHGDLKTSDPSFYKNKSFVDRVISNGLVGPVNTYSSFIQNGLPPIRTADFANDMFNVGTDKTRSGLDLAGKAINRTVNTGANAVNTGVNAGANVVNAGVNAGTNMLNILKNKLRSNSNE